MNVCDTFVQREPSTLPFGRSILQRTLERCCPSLGRLKFKDVQFEAELLRLKHVSIICEVKSLLNTTVLWGCSWPRQCTRPWTRPRISWCHTLARPMLSWSHSPSPHAASSAPCTRYARSLIYTPSAVPEGRPLLELFTHKPLEWVVYTP